MRRTLFSHRPLLVLLVLFGHAACGLAADKPSRPNILWLTCEDTSPDLGCYGDSYAATPNLDRLAGQGARYNLAFSHAPVCAPSRSGLILGMYPTTVGSHHMRSNVPPKAEWRTYSAYLRDAGYYCTNNSKTDYNFPVPKDAWDENSPKAHYRNRRDKSQPFFAVFNYTVSHESQSRPTEQQYANNTRRLTAEQRHDPAKAKLPAYYPDTPVVRKNWAICYDNVTAVDYLVADALKELEDEGLADNTVVFFYGDHGRGLTRGKRWLYDSGTRVPLLVRWPKKIQPASVVEDLVAFVDLGPTVLSIAGVPIPKNMQGQAFLGDQKAAKPREYVYGARDRMDERYDMIRTVRDQRYRYIRNYMPWKPYAQHVDYGTHMPIFQELKRLHDAGELKGPPALWMAATKPVEELYDCVNDPDEVNNLIGNEKYAGELTRLREALFAWMDATNDLGVLPEELMLDAMRKSPSDWREKLVSEYDLVELRRALPQAAANSSQVFAGQGDALLLALWAEQRKPTSDLATLSKQLEDDNFAIALRAAIVLDEMGEKARPMIDALKKANARDRANDYVQRVTSHALVQLGEKPTYKGKK